MRVEYTGTENILKARNWLNGHPDHLKTLSESNALYHPYDADIEKIAFACSVEIYQLVSAFLAIFGSEMRTKHIHTN